MRTSSSAETRSSPPHTLCVDIGGSRIKASVLDAAGAMLAPRLQALTPADPRPSIVLDVIAQLAAQLPKFDRVSIGFPGVVRGGTVLTAPNLGTPNWAGFEMTAAVGQRFGRPVRMLNDAAVQGLGVAQGRGLQCVVTLGTGVGCALLRSGRLLLPLELGQHRARKRLTYDQYIGQAAFDKIGAERWNRRLAKAVDAIISLTTCEVLYVGGGNQRHITAELPPIVARVSNTAGVTGGVRLWSSELDDLFEADAMSPERSK